MSILQLFTHRGSGDDRIVSRPQLHYFSCNWKSMTAHSSRQRYSSTRYTFVSNYYAKSDNQFRWPPKPVIKRHNCFKIQYDREGRRIAEKMEMEPRALLQLRKEELMDREKEVVEKIEKLKRLRDTLRKRISAGANASNSTSENTVNQPVSGG